jgi:putative membrane protein
MKTLTNALIAGLLMIGASAIAHAAGPTDAQIAAIVVAANTADIEVGKLAESKASTPDVKAFARQMVFDHSGVNQQAVALVTRLHVTPEENDTSRSLKKGSDENTASLKRLSGNKFDKAYVDHEVAYHQSVIDALDKTLIPNAQNAELKNLLVQVRPAFIAHLEHAKHVQGELK